MKILYTLILCLCSLVTYSQSAKTNSTDGTYLFEKAVFTISNSNSKSEVDRLVITDPASIDTTNLFLENIFSQATINNGILSFCILPDQSEYTVEDGIILLPAKEEKAKKDMSEHRQKQLAPYSTSFHDNILTFTFIYPYGDSKYDFPLEGKLTITLTKQK